VAQPDPVAAPAHARFMRRRAWVAALPLMAGAGFASAQRPETEASQGGGARVLAVGPGRAVKSLAEAARLAQDGDTLEVDAGDYPGDVAVWTQDRLVIRAVGGRARLAAAGRSAEGKAIWVVRGGDIRAEGLDFSGASVPSKNGAGIRFERGRLTLRDCGFFNNENGILTASDPGAELHLGGCEFGHNGYGDGYSHNLYVNAIARLTVTGSYFHHARVGHLLKSRAVENHILYNRLTDEEGGRASYELEFPNGGIARVLGNIIAQGATTENSTLVSFGAEGYMRSTNTLYLVHNTLVDGGVPNARLLVIRDGDRQAMVANNLLVGGARFDPPAGAQFERNLHAPDASLGAAERHDYRLRRAAAKAFIARPLDGANDGVLTPRAEYVHPLRTRLLGSAPLLAGALQSLAD
jgi:hypothetical protein